MLEIFIGIFAGILGILGLGYQLYKMAKTRDTTAISYNLSVLVGLSISLWMFYGIFLNNPVIYVPNLILVVILAGMFGYKMKNEKTYLFSGHL